MIDWLKNIFQRTGETGKRPMVTLLKIHLGKPQRKSEPVIGKPLTGLDEKK